MFKQVFAGRNGTIYAINQQGELLWFRYLGFPDGSAQWERTAGVKIGSDWGGFHRVMASNDGVLYAIHPNGDLYWYKHLGHETGAATWANDGSGILVGSGWARPARVTAADDGVLYLLRENGELLWYRHTGYQDGAKTWAGPVLVHSGFDQFDAVEASSDGVLYCRKNEYDELYWYKHLGYETGTASWADYKHVGEGWNAFGRLVVSNAGVIYVVTGEGTLRWYRHDGFADGTRSWRNTDLASGFGAQVSLQNGGYLSADPSRDNQLFCASSTLGDKERFQLIYLDEKFVALQTPSGSYVGVNTQVADAPLFANRSMIGATEKFTLKEIVLPGVPHPVYEITASNGRKLIIDWTDGAGQRVLANSQPNVGYPSWRIEDRTPPLSLPPPILANMPALREVWTERMETGVWTDPYYNYSTRTYQESYALFWRQLYVGFVAYDTPQRGTLPIYRESLTVGSRTYCRLSSVARTEPYPDGWRQVEVAFHAYATQMTGTVPVYHERDGSNDFYSVRPKEAAQQSGWTQQGVAFYAYPADILRPHPRVVLKDAATEKYIHLDRSATNNLVARRASIGGGEPLSVIYLGQGRVALQASTGMYLSSASGQGLVANATAITPTEVFACYEGNQLAHWHQGVPVNLNLLASNGKWLLVNAQGDLVATGAAAPTSGGSAFFTEQVPSTAVGAEALAEVYEDASVNGPNLFKYTTEALVPSSGWERRGVAFAAYSSEQPGTVPIYLETPEAEPGSRFHLWHRTVAEAQSLDWVQQGVAFHAFMWQAPGTIPVYRDEKNNKFRFSTRSDVAAAEAGFNRWDIAFYAYPAEAMQQRFVKIRNPIMKLQLEAQDGKVYQNTPNDHWPGRHIEVRPEPSGGVRLLCYDRKHIVCDESGALVITTDPTQSGGVFEIEPVGNSSKFRLRTSSGKVVCFGPTSSDFGAVKAESQAVLQSGSGYRWNDHAVFEWVPYSSATVPLEVEHKVPAPSGPEPSGAEVRQRIVTARTTSTNSAEQQVLDAALGFLDDDLNLPVTSMRVSVNPNLVAGLLFTLNKEAVRVLSLCAGGIDWRSYANADENPLWVEYKKLMMMRKAYKVQKLLDEFKEPKNAKMAKSTKFLKLFKAIVGGPLKVYFMTAGTAMIELSAADIAKGGAGGCQILMPWATPGIFIPFPPGFIKEDEQFTWTDLARAANPYAQEFVTKLNELYTQSSSGLQTSSNWIKSLYVTEAARVTEMMQGIGNPAFATAEVAAKNLKALGYGATEAVHGIVGVYNTTAQQTANALKSAGYAGEQIASSITGIYGLTKTGVEQTIENAGIGLNTAVTTIGTGLTAGATTVGSWIAGLFRA